MDNYILQVMNNKSVITYVIIGITIVVTVCISLIWIRIADLKRTYNQRKIFIEITPPVDVSKTPATTEQLFHILYGTGRTQQLRHRLLRRNNIFSLEITSTRREGVRYVIATSEQEASSVERNLGTFLNNSRIKRIDDPLLGKNDYTEVKEFKQSKHFALPIRTLSSFEQNDPVAYITGAMSRLSEDEQVTMQLVICPARVRNMATIVQRYREFYKISEATHNKAYGNLFRSELRMRIVAPDAATKSERIHGMEAAISSFSIPKVQTLKTRYNFPQALRGRYREWAFTHRMPSLLSRHSNIFSSLELANLYHFPSDRAHVVSHSRTLATPLSVSNNDNFDLILGKNRHHGVTTNIGLTAKERERHMYIVGGTGNGKTTMLQYAIVQDIMKGKGVAVVDPHGDLAEKLLMHIPEERIKDVIYLNPVDISNPIGLNLLEIPQGLAGDNLLMAQDFVTEAVVSIFRKIFSEDNSGGHRIEHVLRNAVHTAFTVEGATLFTIRKLLNDPDFRKPIVAKLEDEDLKDFWTKEFVLAGSYQKYKALDGITTKIARFQRSAATRRIFEQTISTINFDEILDGKILICNLAKGSIGEDTSNVLGTTILTKLQLAAYRRIRQKEDERIPFYLYVDEFQNFVSPLFMQILSESRKYKLFLTMAEQSTSQQDHQMVENIFDNAGTIISFRTGNPADERYLLPLFQPYIKEGEISSLPSFNFYMRIAAVNAQEPFSGETVLLETDGSKTIADRVIEASKKNYAIEYKPSEASEPEKPKELETKNKPISKPKRSGSPKKDHLKK